LAQTLSLSQEHFSEEKLLKQQEGYLQISVGHLTSTYSSSFQK
jgi:hypothetical protein